MRRLPNNTIKLLRFHPSSPLKLAMFWVEVIFNDLCGTLSSRLLHRFVSWRWRYGDGVTIY